MSDSAEHYRLVFTGKLLPGYDEISVIDGLMRILHLDQEKAARLVAGKHNQINKNLKLERAEKLRMLILSQGAECVLLPIEESFITTQQLPQFVSDDADDSDKNDRVLLASTDHPESISEFRQRAMSPGRSKQVLYLSIIILMMFAEAVIIWNFKPGQSSTESNGDSSVKKASPSAQLPLSSIEQSPERVYNASESETDRKLSNLSDRVSVWFSEQGSETNPIDVNWIWIQGDSAISVKDMIDNWGNSIRYYGDIDGFELRSPGIDGKFYSKDDIFRKTLL